VVSARKILRQVETADRIVLRMSELCMSLGVDGMRGELTLLRAARASTALDGRKQVKWEDAVAVAPMVLRHRLRRDPLDETGSAVRIERAIAAMQEKRHG
jgi:magnesium chelatase subunit I